MRSLVETPGVSMSWSYTETSMSDCCSTLRSTALCCTKRCSSQMGEDTSLRTDVERLCSSHLTVTKGSDVPFASRPASSRASMTCACSW